MRTLATLGAAVLLAGCGAMTTVTSDVSSYGPWPAGRAPGSYVFERLPSQQAQPEQQAQLEDAARPALEHAGFKEAADASQADVIVQLGGRVTRYDRSPWDDPFWWRWNGAYWRHPGWRSGMGFGLRYDLPYFEREVALLMRDRKTGNPLFEARATNDGAGSTSVPLLSAMYEAALKDFPLPAVNPRRVSVQVER